MEKEQSQEELAELSEKDERQQERDSDLLNHIKEKSEDDYEKNITYISAGTLVLSLTFVEKIVNLGQSAGVVFLIISWVLMGLTLGINLVSHQLAGYYSYTAYNNIRAGQIDTLETFLRQNRLIMVLNWVTTGSLFLGISCLIVFCSLNAFKMANKPNNSTIEKKVVDTSGLEHRGRLLNIPTNALKPVPNTTTTSGNATTTQNNAQSGSDKK